jgi:hypothetical protein
MNVTRGFAPDDEVSDDMLAAAARRAVLRRLEREGGDAASIIKKIGWTKNVHRHRNRRDIDGGDSASIGLDPKKKVIR